MIGHEVTQMATQHDILATLDERRLELGLSVANLARHAGLGTATVQRALRGKGTASFAAICAMAHVIGMDIDIVRERKVSGVRARQAEKKAERLVQLTRGNAALENSFLTEKEATQFRRGAAQRLLRGSNYALWA